MRTVTTAARMSETGAALSALAAIACVTPLAAGLLAGAASTAVPLGLGSLSVALAAFRSWLDGYYEERFVNTARAWRRKGGLSLVKR